VRELRNAYARAAKLAALGCGAVLLFAGGVGVAGVTGVTLADDGPAPATITVKWGDTVTFSNAGPKPHAVTIPRISASSPLLQAGEGWSRVFDGRAGRYPFRQVQGRGFPGLVVVELSGKVTMKASANVVTWGRRVTFTGTSLPSYPVRVEQLLAPQSGEWVERVTVMADAEGKWSTSLVAKAGGRYRATAAAGQLKSPTFSLGVQPAVSLVAPKNAKAKQMVTVRGRIVPAGAATIADLESYDRDRRRWVREDRRRVNAKGNVSFRWEAVRGRTQLRLHVHRFGLRPGFAAVDGKPVVVNVR
jgi:plastocyanin